MTTHIRNRALIVKMRAAVMDDSRSNRRRHLPAVPYRRGDDGAAGMADSAQDGMMSTLPLARRGWLLLSSWRATHCRGGWPGRGNAP